MLYRSLRNKYSVLKIRCEPTSIVKSELVISYMDPQDKQRHRVLNTRFSIRGADSVANLPLGFSAIHQIRTFWPRCRSFRLRSRVSYRANRPLTSSGMGTSIMLFIFDYFDDVEMLFF